ncbi:hypothetical protein ACXIUS_15010 [Bosea thiooxidans]|nr:hypothetical protein [Bosea sp. (in: a-proteobacteria)]
MTDNEDEIALYDSIERAIANVRAALDAIDQAWIRVTAERPNPTPAALAALDMADDRGPRRSGARKDSASGPHAPYAAVKTDAAELVPAASLVGLA